ncbi:hypothetical protein QOZ80_5AG0364850 [Eleusine coracana subsp. coracana]|nr:hypothetical protein QOZ80_5AG0364850 [Eleusine coracana subsp. coracana]
MLYLRRYLLSTARVASPLADLHRQLLYSTTTTSPVRFAVEEFLVATCGLTPVQALKSSKHLAHLKSPSKPEAVLTFLNDIGMAKADVAAAIASDHLILCSRVDTLKRCVATLHEIGLSPPQICSLISLIPRIVCRPGQIRRIEFYLSFVGSFDKVHTIIKRNAWVLDGDLERVVKPNIAFLRQCGMTDCEIVKAFSLAWCPLVRAKPERLKEIVVCADELGVPRHSAMFKHALVRIYAISPEKIGSRLDFLKKAIGCSEAEVRIAVLRNPAILAMSDDRAYRHVDFLKMKVGLEPNYIAHTPVLLGLSLTRRLVPRHFVLETLKARGLVKKDMNFCSVAIPTEKAFIKRFLDPYKESVPGLADAYAVACAGQLPSSVLH